MESCRCSIFDVREEQILEANGCLHVRLICNLCGAVLDTKMLRQTGREERTRVRRRVEGEDDLLLESNG